MNSIECLESYRLATNEGGFFELDSRCWLELTGEDRVSFLQNFCTADVAKLATRSAAELFILDRRGKTLAFGHVLSLESRLIVTTALADQSEALRQHLDMYIIREQVAVADRTNELAMFYMIGDAQTKLEQIEGLRIGDCQEFMLSGIQVLAAKLELAGPGTALMVDKSDVDSMRQALSSVEVEALTLDVFTTLRVESGTPEFGADMDDSNLPQELRRDEKAISFEKGCYLGQETVAKIDAFGNVGRFLVGIMFESPNPPVSGGPVYQGESKIGVLRTIAYSPNSESWIGLAYVKRQFADVGTQVKVENGVGRIVELPLHKKPN